MPPDLSSRPGFPKCNLGRPEPLGCRNPAALVAIALGALHRTC